MGTRAIITLRETDTPCSGVYFNQDGYPKGVGLLDGNAGTEVLKLPRLNNGRCRQSDDQSSHEMAKTYPQTDCAASIEQWADWHYWHTGQGWVGRNTFTGETHSLQGWVFQVHKSQ